MIKLHKLEIKNFKIFDSNTFSINFDQSDLTILGGPNGYGKTSVFDAIELALTGNISRLHTLENRQHPIDVVVAHKQAEDVEIKVVFKNSNNDTHTFIRKLKKNVKGVERKISSFSSLWDLKRIVNDNEINCEQSDFDDFMESQDFSRDFLLFHYVQQEETARFLKTYNETSRAEELSRLFGNTQSMQDKINKYSKIKSVIDEKYSSINEDIGELKKNYNIENIDDVKPKMDSIYFSAFPWLNEVDKVEWDRELIENYSAEKYNKFINEINLLKDLSIKKDLFLKAFRLNSFLNSRQTIRTFVEFYKFVNNFEGKIQSSNDTKMVKKAYDVLITENPKNILDSLNISGLFRILNLNEDDFSRQLNNYNELYNKIDGLKSLYFEIIKEHDLLKGKIELDENNKNCYLCGHEYQSNDSLKNAILKHGDLIKLELSKQDENFVKCRDNFLINYLKPLIVNVENFLSNNIILPDDYVFKMRSEGFKDKILKIESFFIGEGVEYLSLFEFSNHKLFTSDEVDEICNYISNRILKIMEDLFLHNNISRDDFFSFEKIYIDIFKKDKNQLVDFDLNILDAKEIYLKELYFNSLNDIRDKINVSILDLSELKRASILVGGIVNKMKEEVRKYRKKLITDIEIPFFIYSGKILQSHQAGEGNGVFIKDQSTDEDQLRNIKLVADLKTDHDVLNTMSSGQISAVVIALTLALNKVYSKDFSSIFIDDPVQTMDDVNMSSLLELLRNDFSEKNIILSTHEDKVLQFFTYKYLKFNRVVKLVNIMKREEYIPSNNYIYN